MSKSKLSDAQWAKAKELQRQGLTLTVIAQRFGMDRKTLSRRLSKMD